MEDNLLLGTTQVWDITEVAGANIDNPELKELFVKLYQNLNLMALTVNNKVSGVHSNLKEYACGETYFPTDADTSEPRAVYSKTVNFGQLPNGTDSKPHGIDAASFLITDIHAGATDTTAKIGIGLPYASPVPADNIEIWTDATDVYIKTGKNRNNFDTCYVTIKYLKS